MKLIRKIRRKTKNFISLVAQKIMPLRWKEYNELLFWKRRKDEEGELNNNHYKYFYTTHFGLDESDYTDKVILDIGCGPRGSLEWASMAKKRFGVDPLVAEYLKLGASKHKMEYIDSPSENIPLANGECDIVCSFNSLDHVETIELTVKEIKRLTKTGGKFLLLVEVNHPPTEREPHSLTPLQLVKYFEPEFKCEKLNVYRPVKRGMYSSIRASSKIEKPKITKEIGFLSGLFTRVISN